MAQFYNESIESEINELDVGVKEAELKRYILEEYRKFVDTRKTANKSNFFKNVKKKLDLKEITKNVNKIYQKQNEKNLEYQKKQFEEAGVKKKQFVYFKENVMLELDDDFLSEFQKMYYNIYQKMCLDFLEEFDERTRN